MKYRLTSPPEPYARILHCPICGWEVHRDVPGDQRPYTVVAQESEDACHQHLRNHHPVQYRLWLRFGWSWLIRGFV